MKGIFTILSFLCVFQLQSQNYISYFNLVNEATKQLYYKNYHAAAENYEKAILSVPYTHNNVYAYTAIAFSNLKNYKKARKYLKKAILQGWNGSRFQGFTFEERFTRTTHWKKWMIEHTLKPKVFDTVYIQKIDSLYNIDQNIIRGNHSVEETKQFSDSLVFAALLKLINERGFPKEEILGQDAYDKAAIIIHHNGRLVKNESYMNYWEDCVKKGWYLPTNYAWMYDQYLVWGKKEKPYFYQCIAPIDKLSESEIKVILQNRYNMGVPDFDGYIITGDSRSLSFQTKYTCFF